MQYDDRITRKVEGTRHITLTCRNHPNLAWSTKNIGPIGARSIFFNGEWPRVEGGKMSAEGMIPSRQQALKMLADGTLLDRNDKTGETFLVDNEESRAMVNARYDDLETKFTFECPCPGRDLIVHPMYDEMPDVDM